MAGDNPSLGELRDWLLLSQAYELVSDSFGPQTAQLALLQQLEAGLIRAYAEKHDSELDGDKSPMKEAVLIEPKMWEHLAEYTRMWASSQAVVEVSNYNLGRRQTYKARFFGIRLEPEAVASMIPRKIPPLASPSPKPAAIPSAAAPAAKGPASPTAPPTMPDTRNAVPGAALAKWATAFVGTYGHNFKGDFALRSARAMFPDNSVGKNRVEAALMAITGKRKRGAKTTEAGNNPDKSGK